MENKNRHVTFDLNFQGNDRDIGCHRAQICLGLWLVVARLWLLSKSSHVES